MEFSRLVRWAILEDSNLSVEELTQKLADIRADFYGRGLKREDIGQVFAEEHRPRALILLKEYYSQMSFLDVDKKPSEKEITNLFPALKKLNKEFYTLTTQSFLLTLNDLDDGSPKAKNTLPSPRKKAASTLKSKIKHLKKSR